MKSEPIGRLKNDLEDTEQQALLADQGLFVELEKGCETLKQVNGKGW